MKNDLLGKSVMKLLSYIFMITILPSISFAASNSKAQFFYSLPEEATNDWAYQISECTEMNAKNKTAISKCEKFSNHEVCKTNMKVQLQNVTNTKSQEFKIVYHVFKVKNDCNIDRETALSGE